jgi:tRNA pseudouridine32 synthase / 23S rRNA pseudouridine746 synthase
MNSPPVLYISSDLVVVDKPVGLSTIKERDPSVPFLQGYLEELLGESLFVVHRLDKEVSGAIIFARNEHAHRYMNGLFNKRQIKKTYLAVAQGVIIEDCGTIEAAIRTFGSGRMGVDSERGKQSTTDFKVRERLRDHTLLTAEPSTGRRHQLRVHFYHIGHPLAGDRKYGDSMRQASYSRLLLHAHSLAFCLPSEEDVRIEAEVPASFEEAVNTLRG